MHVCTFVFTCDKERTKERWKKPCLFTTISLSLCQSVFTIIKINFVVTSSSDLFLCMCMCVRTFLCVHLTFLQKRNAKKKRREYNSKTKLSNNLNMNVTSVIYRPFTLSSYHLNLFKYIDKKQRRST